MSDGQSALTYSRNRHPFHTGILELFENTARIIRRLLKRVKNPVPHLDGRLECRFLASVLTVREVFCELIPLAADTQTPTLKGGRLICVACDVSLSHVCMIVV